MTKKKITPIRDVLVVKLDPKEEVTQGDLVVATKAEAKKTKGVIVAAGPKVTEVKVNDHVLFGEYAGTELTMDGVEYRVMREEEIFCRI